VLTAVAGRLTTGRATGIDIWNTLDQSGNAQSVTLRNASLEGVADRVRIETGDMRKCLFPTPLLIWWSPASRSTTSVRMPIASKRSAKASVP